MRSDLKGGNENELGGNWNGGWLKARSDSLENLRLRVTGPGKEGKWARGLLFRRRDTLWQCTLALLLLYSNYAASGTTFVFVQLLALLLGPTCGALSPLTGHHLQYLIEGTGSSTVALGRAETCGTCSYTTWTCSTGRGGRVESAASGTTLLLVVVLRVRTYRTRELQPEHWSLLTYHGLAKSWLPTVSKYPWCCATSFLPFLATLVVVGTNKSPRGAGSKINICVFATSRENTRV